MKKPQTPHSVTRPLKHTKKDHYTQKKTLDFKHYFIIFLFFFLLYFPKYIIYPSSTYQIQISLKINSV